MKFKHEQHHNDVKSGEFENKKIVVPIHLQVDPMKRLLIGNFVNDREYEALEPQLFDDDVNGKGLRVLMYRNDKKVDVYWQPGVVVNPDTFNIGAGLGHREETEFEKDTFQIDECNVSLHIAFTDRQGRKVEMIVKEHVEKSNRMRFLAPVGKDIEHPEQFFLAYMLGFDFIRNQGTTICAKIGDRLLKPASFPVLRNLKKVMFVRYSAKPAIGVLNPPMDTPVIFHCDSPGKVIVDGLSITVNHEKKIITLEREYDGITYQLDFLSGVSNVLELHHHETEKREWILKIANDFITSGTYCVRRIHNDVHVEIDVTGVWDTSKLPLSFRIFTGFFRSFKTWPATYKWTGTVTLGEKISMKGAWTRKK